MDYSKIGTNLYYTVISNANDKGINIKDSSVSVTLSNNTLAQCDTVLINNEAAFRSAFDAKPLNVVVNNLNAFGEIAYKFLALVKFKLHTQSLQDVEKYFADLKIGSLMQAYQKGGIDAVYTLFLNKAAAGTDADTFNKLNKILNDETKKLCLNSPTVSVMIKGILQNQDLDFLEWKKSGFHQPYRTELPHFTRNSYEATNKYFQTGRLDEKIPDGFRDGGRHVEFDSSGKVSQTSYPNREIIYVDRQNDKVLNDALKHLKDIFARNPYLSEKEKIKTIFAFVDRIYRVKDGIQHAADFPCVPMKLGYIINSGAGVCRHMAITAKVLADDLGLKMSLVRGRHKGSDGYLGAHIWNEVELSNGKKYLFDTAQGEFVDFASRDNVLDKYYTDSKVRMYI